MDNKPAPGNVWLGILWGLIIVFVIVVLIILAYQAYKSYHEKPVTPCSQIPSTGLIDLSTTPLCTINGQSSTYRYYRDLNLTMAPFPTYYSTVCAGFCSKYNYSNNTCGDADPSAWQACITRSKPNNCQGSAAPIATLGAALYYGYSAGNICDTQ